MLADTLVSRIPALRASSRLKQLAATMAVALAVLALALPMLQAEPAALTSDESLYLSEAYNIATGVGPKYASQEFVSHRAPLYPALLAVPLRLTGGNLSSAYWIPKLIVLALAGAAYLLARQLFGALAGGLAAVLVMSSAFLRLMGTTLFLDGTETLFMLLFLTALWRAFQSESIRWFALSGVLLGAAFLTKETAFLWLPLPVAFALLSSEYRNERIARGLSAYGASAGAMLAVWWVWVFAVTDRVYFWGPPDARLAVWGAAVAVGAGATGLVWVVVSKLDGQRLPMLARAIGIALVAGWVGGIFVFLEFTSWPFPKEHWRTVPQYLWQIAALNSQPWPLIALGALWPLARVHKDPRARLLALGLALFLPFALFVANRTFSYRDLLPMVYLAYVGAAGLGAVAVRWSLERGSALGIGAALVIGLAAFGLVQTQELTQARLPYDRTAVTQENWDNPLVHSTARWLHENVPAGAGVMASRLYFSHLYVLDEGRHPIYQLPTLRIEPQAGEAPFLKRITTLFRWEDHRMGPASEDERWLYVQRYPAKLYFIGLSERDLLRDLEERSVDYLVLAGEDAGFSLLTYQDYFEQSPAFKLVYADEPSTANSVYIYRVDRSRLAEQDYRTVVSRGTLAALARSFGDASPEELANAIDPDGIVIRP